MLQNTGDSILETLKFSPANVSQIHIFSMYDLLLKIYLKQIVKSNEE